jgi:CRISPR type IV-associated protein Csf3
MAEGIGQLVTYGEPCEKGEPLRITARLAEGIVLRRPLMLDGILAWSVAAKNQLLAPPAGQACDTIEIPIQREPGGRFHLCSQALFEVEASDLRYKNRRAPVQEFARLGSSKIKRVDIAAGANKSYRVPYSLELLVGDTLTWYCLGDRSRIDGLLSIVHYLGRHRGAGKGRLDLHGEAWRVAPCETWGPRFPVLDADGLPMRPMPLDWPGLSGGSQQMRVLTYPYYDQARAEMAACPT